MADAIADISISADEITQMVEVGHPSDTIIDKIRELDIDLVVMGTNGTSGIQEFLAGSNAEKVVRKASCPVITLKSPVKLEAIKRIAFASDFGDLNEHSMALLKQMQDLLGAQIDFVRVNTPNNFQRDPADRIIVATAISENLPLLTYDKKIIKSGLVKIFR